MTRIEEVISLVEDTYAQVKQIEVAMKDSRTAIHEGNPFKLFRILTTAREALAEAIKTTGFAVEVAEAEQSARIALQATLEVEAMYLQDVKREAMRMP